jgi:pSer/pThr/pTyr-binding forkhead associated (FHA) protein
MAKVLFIGLDGTERSYRLQTHRPFTVGRDPGNDIVLRDPKVSRHHAEVVFERGFFVLHDLASANGSFINGKRIRVAPLTHGSQLRLGNTIGRFSEELPTESDRAAKLEGPVPPHPNIDHDITPHPTAPQPRHTAPNLPADAIGLDDSKKK